MNEYNICMINHKTLSRMLGKMNREEYISVEAMQISPKMRLKVFNMFRDNIDEREELICFIMKIRNFYTEHSDHV